MVIITPAYKFIKHLHVLLPSAYLERVLLIYKRGTKGCVSVCYFTNLISMYLFLSPAFTEGFFKSRGSPAVQRGEVVGFHHLLMWGLWYHEEQLWGAIPGAGVSHLHVPTRGQITPLFFLSISYRTTRSMPSSEREAVSQSILSGQTDTNTTPVSCFSTRPSLDFRHHSGVWFVVQPVRTPSVPGKCVWPQVQFSSAGHALPPHASPVTVEPQQTYHQTEVVKDRWGIERGSK